MVRRWRNKIRLAKLKRKNTLRIMPKLYNSRFYGSMLDSRRQLINELGVINEENELQKPVGTDSSDNIAYDIIQKEP